VFEFEFLFQPGPKFTFELEFEFKLESAFAVTLNLELELATSSSTHLPTFLSSSKEATAICGRKRLTELNFYSNLVRKLPFQDPKFVSN